MQLEIAFPVVTKDHSHPSPLLSRNKNGRILHYLHNDFRFTFRNQKKIVSFCRESNSRIRTTWLVKLRDFVFSSFRFISLIADGPHHYHPACGHKGSSHLSPVHALHFFFPMQVQHSYNSSTNGWILLTHVPTLSVRACINDVRKIKIGKSKSKINVWFLKKHCDPC